MATDLDVGGDDAKSVYARYRVPLISYFRRRGQLTSDAEDLTQQVFVRLLGRSRDETSDIGPSFIFTIANNLLKDRRRSTIRSGDHVGLENADDWVYEQDRDAQAATQERSVVAKYELQTIVRALGELSPETQQMFIMARLDQAPYADIAERFGCSTRTVKRAVATAIAHMTASLGSDGQDEA